ncbi:MAG: YdhR family protein [Pseudolabrys sp.]
MITTVVQFALSHPVTLEEATKMFDSTAPKYRNLPGLVRKYYLRSEDGRKAGGVYLWENKAAAEKAFSGEWKARVKLLYGSEPDIAYFDTPVIVDNQAGGSITKAA